MRGGGAVEAEGGPMVTRPLPARRVAPERDVSACAAREKKMHKIQNAALGLAAQLGLDASTIAAPTGPSGFVSVRDVLDAHDALRGDAPLRRSPSSPLQPRFAMTIRPGITLRPYQQEILSRLVRDGRVHSGLVICPCGAGKTLIGAALVAMAGCRTLVLTSRAPEQWQRHFTDFFCSSGLSIAILGAEPLRVSSLPDIAISTYSYVCTKASSTGMRALRSLGAHLLLLDEVHCAASHEHLSFIEGFPCSVCVGMTATPMREDNRFRKVREFVGPLVAAVGRDPLEASGHVSRVDWINLTVPMFAPPSGDARTRMILSTLNPHKIWALLRTLEVLVAEGDHVLVYCDDIYCLHRVHEAITGAGVRCSGLLTMKSRPQDRRSVLAEFQREPGCIVVSRVGDEAYDIPKASAAISVWNGWGSRRQTEQRIGRITRPGHHARFILLVSEGTREMHFVDHRVSSLGELYFPHTERFASSSFYRPIERGYLHSQAQLLTSSLAAHIEQRKSRGAGSKAERPPVAVKRARKLGKVGKMRNVARARAPQQREEVALDAVAH